MRPDFDRTMTGYWWLDRTLAPILNPYNAIVGWIYERRLDHALGIYGTTKERRDQRYRIFAAMDQEGAERPVLWDGPGGRI